MQTDMNTHTLSLPFSALLRFAPLWDAVGTLYGTL